MNSQRLILADVKSLNIDGHSIGHYFSLAHNYLDNYASIFDTKIGGGPIYKTQFTPEVLFALPYDSLEKGNSIKNKWHVLKNCYYLFHKTTPKDIIVLQHSGASTTFLGIALLGRKKNNIYVIQYNTDALKSLFQRLIYRLAKKKIKGIICPSAKIGEAYQRPYCIVTDYIYPKSPDFFHQEKRSYKDKNYDFAVVGGIYPDKGVVEIANYLKGTKFTLLIAGAANTELSNQLKNIAESSENIELHLGFVSDNEYYNFIRSSRYCILNYHGVYSNRSSGVVLDILFNGTPIIGHQCNALQFVKDEKVGFLFKNIQDFNPEMFLHEQIYENYLRYINVFLLKQKDYRNRFINFIKQSKLL